MEGTPGTKVKINLAWADHFPNPNHHILAVFNVFANLSFNYALSNRKELQGIKLLLESMWTDETILDKKDMYLVDCFIKNNQEVSVSRNPNSAEREQILQYSLNVCLSDLKSTTDTDWSHVLSVIPFPSQNTGLCLPDDISYRVFEYLLDYGIIEKIEPMPEGSPPFFVFTKTVITNYEVDSQPINKTRYLLELTDIQHSDIFYKSVIIKCHTKDCKSFLAKTTEVGSADTFLSKLTTYVCDSCGNTFFYLFHIYISTHLISIR